MNSPRMYEDRLFTPDQVTLERQRRKIHVRRNVRMPHWSDMLMWFFKQLGG